MRCIGMQIWCLMWLWLSHGHFHVRIRVQRKTQRKSFLDVLRTIVPLSTETHKRTRMHSHHTASYQFQNTFNEVPCRSCQSKIQLKFISKKPSTKSKSKIVRHLNSIHCEFYVQVKIHAFVRISAFNYSLHM